MVESQRDISKYNSHPVYADGDLSDLRKLIDELAKLDRKAERRARLWLGPAALLSGPLNGWIRMSEPWRSLVGVLTFPIWIVPLAIGCTVLLPFTLVWLIGYAVLASKDIPNQLLQNCREFLEDWSKHPASGEKLTLTVDARPPAARVREIPLAELSEDYGDQLFSAGESLCFCLEAAELTVEVRQHYRVLHRSTGVGGKISNYFSETRAIEGQSWYEIRLSRGEQKQLIPGAVHKLPGRIARKTNAVDFYGHSLDPKFPWQELRQELGAGSSWLETKGTL